MPESMRRQLERAEELRLAAWAWRSEEATRRLKTEDEGRLFDYRSRFQRDRDRIVYSRAFRRLRQKALVGFLPEYEDHRRNRLTHTLEVAQVARTVGRALQLNEDLIEAIALAHDLGQPPFGPAGEQALDDLLCGRLDGRGGPALGDLGGFWRAWQGLRVVDRIEKRYDHAGLNLSDPVREGILKCGPDERTPPESFEGIRPGLPLHLEGQVVALADRISSAVSDLDDALQAGAVEPGHVERLAAVKELKKKLGRDYDARASRFVKANAIHRGLIHLLVTGLVLHSQRRLGRWAARYRINTPKSFRAVRDDAVRGDEVTLPPALGRMLADLEGFLASRVRRGRGADLIHGRGRRTLLGLFAAYQADPVLLEDHVLLRYKDQTGRRFLRDLPRSAVETEVSRHYRADGRFARLLGDHLAAMTDAYALAEFGRLQSSGALPIPSAEQLRRETSS